MHYLTFISIVNACMKILMFSSVMQIICQCSQGRRWSSEGVTSCQNNSITCTMFLYDKAEVPHYHFDCSKCMCTSVLKRDTHPHITVLLMRASNLLPPPQSRAKTHDFQENGNVHFPQIVLLMMPHTFNKLMSILHYSSACVI